MTKTQILARLKKWVKIFAIDPYDAEALSSTVETYGMDRDTFADTLDGYGYPELAEEIYQLTN